MAEQSVYEDLRAEGDEVDRLVAGLGAADWNRPTPAPGWTVAHQLGHLSFIHRLAGTAAADPEAFERMMAGARSTGIEAAVNAALGDYLNLAPEALLERWRAERADSVRALAAVPDGTVVPWLVRPLPPEILARAGIMELFAHGQDIADALGRSPERTDRVLRLVEFAVLVRDFGYEARGLTPPDVQFRFELTGPSGQAWAFGPEDAGQRVTGDAVDFCLLVTRRRHRDDLAVSATGEEAGRWLDIAQAYRGPAGPGRSPGQFAATVR